jgi:hypothetical protein
MKLKMQLLPLRERLNDRGVLVANAHLGEGLTIGAGRDKQRAVVLEADVPAIEKMID